MTLFFLAIESTKTANQPTNQHQYNSFQNGVPYPRADANDSYDRQKKVKETNKERKKPTQLLP